MRGFTGLRPHPYVWRVRGSVWSCCARPLSVAAALLFIASAGSAGTHLGQPIFDPANAASTGSIPIDGYPGGIVYDPVNNALYVTLQQNGSFQYNMTAINASTDRAVAYIPMPYGVDTMAVDTQNGFVYVGDTVATVYAVSPSTNRIAWTVPAGCPYGCGPEVQTYDSSNGQVFVTDLGNNNVSVIQGRSLLTIIPVGSNPNGAVFDPANGKVFVLDEGDYTMTVVDGQRDIAIGRFGPVDSGPGVTYDNANGEVYVCSNNVTKTNFVTAVNGTTDRVVETIPISTSCGAAVYDPFNNYVYVTDQIAANGLFSSNVTLVDPTTNQLVLTLPVGLGPEGIAYDPLNHNVYVANTYSGPPSAGPTYPGSISILSQVYRVTVNETGLPPGTNWSVALGGKSFSSTTDTISFPELNGSYAYTVAVVGNDTATPASGVVNVTGASRTVSVVFSNPSDHRVPPAFLGLTGNSGYYLLGGGVGVMLVAAASVTVLLRRRRGRSGPSVPTPGSPP